MRLGDGCPPFPFAAISTAGGNLSAPLLQGWHGEQGSGSGEDSWKGNSATSPTKRTRPRFDTRRAGNNSLSSRRRLHTRPQRATIGTFLHMFEPRPRHKHAAPGALSRSVDSFPPAVDARSGRPFRIPAKCFEPTDFFSCSASGHVFVFCIFANVYFRMYNSSFCSVCSVPVSPCFNVFRLVFCTGLLE